METSTGTAEIRVKTGHRTSALAISLQSEMDQALSDNGCGEYSDLRSSRRAACCQTRISICIMIAEIRSEALRMKWPIPVKIVVKGLI
jgi:hypothetical protein